MKRRIEVQADWIETAGMAFLFLVTLLKTIADLKAVLHGHIEQVSYNTVLAAIAATYLAAFLRVEKLFRVGAAVFAAGATIRAVAHYLKLPSNDQWLAGINGLVFSIAAWVMISIGIVQWFARVTHHPTVSDQKDP